MLEIGGIVYIIDVKEFDKLVTTDKSAKAEIDKPEVTTTEVYAENGELIKKEVVTKSLPSDKMVDGARYEMIKYMIDILVSYANEEVDDMLGAQGLNNMPLAFRFAFNTLLYYKIIKQLDI